MVKYKNYDEAMPVLRQWLTTQPHLPIIEETPLKTFIIFCDGDLEQAKLLIDKQYTYRTSNPHIFEKRDTFSSGFENLHDLVDIVLLPDKTPDNHIVVLYRLRSPDLTNYNYTDEIRLVSAFFDTFIRVHPPNVIPNGIFIIIDLKEFTLQHLTKVDLAAVRVLAKFFEDMVSVKIPCTHIINCPTFISKIILLAKKFLAEKTYKKFIIHEKNADDVFNYIPRNILPKDINGTKGTIDELKKNSVQLLKDNHDYIMNSKFWYVDESKRPPNSRKPQFDEMQGNFRTLSVD